MALSLALHPCAPGCLQRLPGLDVTPQGVGDHQLTQDSCDAVGLL